MNKILLTLLLLPITFTLSAQKDISMYKSYADIIEGEQRAHRGMLRFRGSGAGDNIDIDYMRSYWEVNPAVRYISGTIAYHFKALELLNEITLDLNQGMVVDSIVYHGTTVTSSRSNNQLHISLPGVLRVGDRDSIAITYHGVPDATGFGSFIQTTHGKDSIPIIWTLSEPYGASEWWPCKNSLTDKIDSMDVFINTHVWWTAASNGVMVSDIGNPSGMDHTMHWKHRYPIAPYLVSLAVTRYEVFSDTLQSISGKMLPVQNFAYPERLADAMDGTSKVPDMIRFYEDTIAAYPFVNEKYGHAQFGWGGGMEHQTMTSVGGYNYGLLAHELAHQWFGDAVTCKSWRDIWLNESFATYMTALMERHAFGEKVFDNWLVSTNARVTNVPDGSVWVDDTTVVGRIFSGRLSYRKGAYVLHMLRWVLGDEAFFNGIKSYYKDNIGQYATTDDLRSHLEMAGDTSLGGFMDDWFYGQGFPSYEIVYQQADNNLFLTVNQTQSHPSVFFFEMPLPIKIYGEGQDTTVVLQNNYNHQDFHLPVSFQIDSIVFDPEHWILSRDNQVTLRINSLENGLYCRLSPNPAGQIVRLQTNLSPATIRDIRVWDIAGNPVFSPAPARWIDGVDIIDWPVGTYLVELTKKDGRPFVMKLLKE